jgi:hypothetical protein
MHMLKYRYFEVSGRGAPSPALSGASWNRRLKGSLYWANPYMYFPCLTILFSFVCFLFFICIILIFKI